MIPPITDPLGKYWNQPDREDVLVDETHAIMTISNFHKLAEYSTSIPTGVYVGKMWRRHFNGDDYVMWYDVAENPNNCSIQQRKILVVLI